MNKEILKHAWETDGVFGVLSMAFLTAFTKKQREAIRDERDGGKCHFPAEHNCNDKFEVHHIEPQRWSEWQGKEDYDRADNALTVCSNSHDLIHPDRVVAKKRYWRDKLKGKDSFKTLGQIRDQKLRNHEIYWVNIWDDDMKAIAAKLTLDALADDWVFPPKKER